MTLDELNIHEKSLLGVMAEFELAALANLRKSSNYSKITDGFIEIDIHLVSNDQFSAAQQRTFEYIQQYFDAIVDEIFSKIHSESAYLLERNGPIDDQLDGFPIVESKDEYKNFLGFDLITILDDEKDGFAYFGLTGSCTWEPEHGFGVMMYKSSVIELGDYNTGTSGSREIHKHNNTYTEEMRISDEKWEKLRFAKKWWQFWK